MSGYVPKTALPNTPKIAAPDVLHLLIFMLRIGLNTKTTHRSKTPRPAPWAVCS